MEGDSGEKLLVSSASAAPGESGNPVPGTEERKLLMISWSAWVRVRWCGGWGRPPPPPPSDILVNRSEITALVTTTCHK